MIDSLSSGICLNNFLLGLYFLSFGLRQNLSSPLYMAFVWLMLVVQCRQSKQIPSCPLHHAKETTVFSLQTPILVAIRFVRIQNLNLKIIPSYNKVKLTPGLILVTLEKSLNVVPQRSQKNPWHHVLLWDSCSHSYRLRRLGVGYEGLHSCAFRGFPPVSSLG